MIDFLDNTIIISKDGESLFIFSSRAEEEVILALETSIGEPDLILRG